MGGQEKKIDLLFCASEVVPFIKTGGLADVAGTFPLALSKYGINVKIVLPYYRDLCLEGFEVEKIGTNIYSTTIGENTEVYFIEHPRYFDRHGLYQHNGVDFADNLERFVYYCLETLRLIKRLNFKPDIIHCNDWHTALIPVYLKAFYSDDCFYKNIKTVFTIHNLGYQGVFPAEQFSVTGLKKEFFSVSGLEFYGRINLLKGGILFADKITTVSPTYAKEIQTVEFGCGLEGVLRGRKKDIFGILNGINYEQWDPVHNQAIAQNYSIKNLQDKYVNKTKLQCMQNLPQKPQIPVLGIVTRLASQKGLDIFAESIPQICLLDLQVVLLGTGDQYYDQIFQDLSLRYDNFAVNLKFASQLAYHIYAGSDMFVMPSRYEPCGLGQMISLKFGTIPIVRKTGGLADTVFDYKASAGRGNGFVFKGYTPRALVLVIKRALKVYKDKQAWPKLVMRAMLADFSWDAPAKQYLRLYTHLTGKSCVC
ncbi:MAG: glycogen synthase GlgA [Candidatus Omnitrophota bacterium]|nr:MAG: glycogen synthase GlgA [Candidatus Omnitrophota bacterium]